MILYHGSNCEFDVISLETAKNNRDFGKGFYTINFTEKALAKLTLVRRSKWTV